MGIQVSLPDEKLRCCLESSSMYSDGKMSKIKEKGPGMAYN